MGYRRFQGEAIDRRCASGLAPRVRLVRARSWFSGGLSLAAFLLAAPPALAHVVSPTVITLRPGGEDFVYVADQATCPATITVSSNMAGVTVHKLDMTTHAVSGGGASVTVPNRIDQVFVIRAAANAAPGSGTLDVCWVGANWPNPPCDENNCIPPFLPHVVSISVEPLSATAAMRVFSGIAGDPVVTSSGELIFGERADLSLGGVLSVALGRSYASLNDPVGVPASTLGPKWSHNYDAWLTSVGHNYEVTFGSGEMHRFEKGYFDAQWHSPSFERAPVHVVENATTFLYGDARSGLIHTFIKATGQLARIEDRNGNALDLSYAANRLSQVSDGKGRALSFGYTSGKLTSVTDGTRSAQFAYFPDGSLQSATDALGGVTSYTYDPAHPGEALLTARTRPEGNTPTTQTYNASGQVALQLDAFGNSYGFMINPITRETTITDPLSNTQVHTHSAGGGLTRWQDELGFAATLGYDSLGRRNSVTDRFGKASSWTYGATSGLVSSITDAAGSTTSFTYAASTFQGLTFYDLATITRGNGSPDIFTRDGAGNVLTLTTGMGDSWSFSYDLNGHRLSETDPEGGTTSHTYLADGNLESTLDTTGGLTTFGYDAFHRLDLITWPDTTTRSFSYDALDRVLSTTNERAHTSSFVRDMNGNVTKWTDASLQDWSMCYDLMDRRDCVVDPVGLSVQANWDVRGDLASVIDAAGTNFSIGRDDLGRSNSLQVGGSLWPWTTDREGALATSTDANGASSSYTSDVLGRTTQRTDELGFKASWKYSGSRLTQTTDEDGHATTATFGAHGLASLTEPLQLSASYTYDANRSRLSQTMPGGATWSFGRNAAGWLMDETDPIGNVWSYGRDARGRTDLVTFPGALGTEALLRDGFGRITQRAFSDGLSLDYSWHPSGGLLATSGLTRDYDDAGRMSVSNGMTFTRTPAGDVDRLFFTATKWVDFDYDMRRNATRIQDYLGADTAITYDAADQMEQISRSNGVVTSFGYDARRSVSSIQEHDGANTTLSDLQLTRDARAKIVSVLATLPLRPSPFAALFTSSYDVASQVSGHTFDALGRTLDDDVRTYQWDLASRLKGWTLGATQVDYGYDGLDRLTSRTENGVTHEYEWFDAFRRPYVAVEREGGVDVSYNVALPNGKLLYSIDPVNASWRYGHFDAIGNLTYQTDDTGAIRNAYTYAPNGQSLGTGGSEANSFQWLGEWSAIRDPAAELYFVGSRWCDAVTGRYLSRDRGAPSHPKDASPYTFASGDPLDVQEIQSETEANSSVAELEPAFVREIVAKGSLEPACDDDGECGGDEPRYGDPFVEFLLGEFLSTALEGFSPQALIPARIVERPRDMLGVGRLGFPDLNPRSYREVVQKFQSRRAALQLVSRLSTRQRRAVAGFTVASILAENFVQRESDAAVPYLRDVPLIGPLFRRRALAAQRDTLVLLLTPRITVEQ